LNQIGKKAKNSNLVDVRTNIQPIPQEPIRVLFVSHDTGMWGAQRTLLTLLSAIDRRICSPLLVVPYDGPLSNEAAALGIPVFIKQLVHWVPGWLVSSMRQRIGHLYRFFRTLQSRCRAIESLINDHGVDLVYTNTVTCVEGAIAARRTRKTHIWHIHEPILGNSEITQLFPHQLYCSAIDFLSRVIIFPSWSVMCSYPQLSGKASVIYNGLPLPLVCDRIIARMEATKELGIEAGSKIVAVVGALQPRKDYLTFLAAAEQVARRVEEVLFLIVGAGSENYTNLIRQWITELGLDTKVKLLGWWQGDIHDLLAAIDVLVISSEQESFGLTAIEALAMETPVVATRCGGPEEIIEDGITGILVPVKDPCALADAIVNLLLEPELSSCLGINGRKHIVEKFGVDRYVQGIQGIIEKTVSNI
jgi:glycosyltransferase involved in cell wall biosynthesis